MKTLYQEEMLAFQIVRFIEDELEKIRDFSKHTIKSYSTTLKLFLKFLEKKLSKPITKIRTEELNFELVHSWMLEAKRQRNWGPSTWNTRVSALRTFLRYLAKVNIKFLNLHARVSMIDFQHIPRKPVTFISDEELESVLSKMGSSNFYEIRDKMMIQFMFFTGLRVEEVVSVKWTDVLSIGSDLIEFRVLGKGRKLRDYPLIEEATRKNFEKYKDYIRKKIPNRIYIFSKRNGSKMSTQNARRIVAKNFNEDRYGDKITPHIFRHSAAMHWAENGMDTRNIGLLLGHESPSSTERYLQSTRRLKVNALMKAGQAGKVSQLFKTEFTSNEELYAFLDIKISK